MPSSNEECSRAATDPKSSRSASIGGPFFRSSPESRSLIISSAPFSVPPFYSAIVPRDFCLDPIFPLLEERDAERDVGEMDRLQYLLPKRLAKISLSSDSFFKNDFNHFFFFLSNIMTL